MKKNIEWLKRETHKILEAWCGVEDGFDEDVINEIMLLINQFEKPETIEQTALLLENVLKENKRLGKLLEEKHQEWFNLMDEINNQEVLSDKWIDEHITDGHNVNLGDKVVYADELDGVLVPKQEYFLDTLEDGVYAVKDGRIERGNIATEYTNKETEVLSQKWIDDNSVYASSDGITEEYVHVDDLKEILVPKQEDMFNGETPDEGEVYFAIGLGGAIEINVARSIGEAIEILTEHETNYSVSGKPVIPQFVAHVIEAYKSNSSLTNLLADLAFHGELAEFVEHEDEDEVFEWVQSNRKAMDEILARAWLDGFTIADEDEEQKYYVVKSEGLDGVHYYFVKFDDEMNGLFTLPNDKKGAYRFDDKEKAQAIANYTENKVEEL